MKVIKTESKMAYTMVLWAYIDAAILFLSPMEFPIKELQPDTIPIPAAIIIKYRGKDFARAAKDSGEIFPA